jgi:hypothetical protein
MKTSSKVEHFWDLMASSVRMSLYCYPFYGYLKEEMMNDITDMNTNPSSGYPKEEVMDNITNMNTNRSSGYPK